MEVADEAVIQAERTMSPHPGSKRAIPPNIVVRWNGHVRIETAAIHASAIAESRPSCVEILGHTVPDRTDLPAWSGMSALRLKGTRADIATSEAVVALALDDA